MSGYCANGDHEHCPDTLDDTGCCCCTCHIFNEIGTQEVS